MRKYPQAAAQQSVALKYLFLFGVAISVLLVDQASKAIVTDRLAVSNGIAVIGDLLRLDYTRNTGSAFSLLHGAGILLASVAIGVSAGIILYYRRLAGSPVLIRLAVSLILGGAVGNLFDRIRLGYVVDFIHLRWWPVFNLADSAIVTGVAVLAGYSLLTRREGASK